MIVISQPFFIELGLHGGRMDVRKEVSPVRGFTEGILCRSPDFPPSDLSLTTFPSVASHGMLLIHSG